MCGALFGSACLIAVHRQNFRRILPRLELEAQKNNLYPTLARIFTSIDTDDDDERRNPKQQQWMSRRVTTGTRSILSSCSRMLSAKVQLSQPLPFHHSSRPTAEWLPSSVHANVNSTQRPSVCDSSSSEPSVLQSARKSDNSSLKQSKLARPRPVEPLSGQRTARPTRSSRSSPPSRTRRKSVIGRCWTAQNAWSSRLAR